MFRYLLMSILFATFSLAAPFDFVTLHEARSAYEKGEFETAARLYEKLAEKGSDEARFDAADAYYRLGNYEKALKLFKGVKKESLRFRKLHNMGNCYARLGKIDEGIDAYEKALKIKEDADTRFNLELLKKMKKRERQQRQNQQNQQNQKSQKNQQNRQSQQSQQRQQNGRQKKDEGNRSEKNRESQSANGQKREDRKKGEENRNENERKNEKAGDEKQRKSQKSRKGPEKESENGHGKDERTMKMEKRDEPISDMELRKWNRVLNRRGIHTLMLPMPTQKGERSDDETTPW